MQIEDMILVSIDDHIIEPANMFDNHMPDKFKDQAPRYVREPKTGRGYWEFQGQETGMSGLGAVASWPHEEWDMDPVDFAEMRPAFYDVDLRIRDMNANGQLTGMCFPTFAGFNGMSLARSTVDRDSPTWWSPLTTTGTSTSWWATTRAGSSRWRSSRPTTRRPWWRRSTGWPRRAVPPSRCRRRRTASACLLRRGRLLGSGVPGPVRPRHGHVPAHRRGVRAAQAGQYRQRGPPDHHVARSCRRWRRRT